MVSAHASSRDVIRHFGGIRYNGKHYKIAVDEPGQPLVRVDVLAKERRQRRESKQAEQGDLI